MGQPASLVRHLPREERPHNPKSVCDAVNAEREEGVAKEGEYGGGVRRTSEAYGEAYAELQLGPGLAERAVEEVVYTKPVVYTKLMAAAAAAAAARGDGSGERGVPPGQARLWREYRRGCGKVSGALAMPVSCVCKESEVAARTACTL